MTHDPCTCNKPTSGRPVDLRSADTDLGLQRDSRHAILENVLAGRPCLRNRASHWGQVPVVADARVVVSRDREMMIRVAVFRMVFLSTGDRSSRVHGPPAG